LLSLSSADTSFLLSLSLFLSLSKKKDQLADFSSRGPTADGRRKPDVVAPGMGILSAAARNGQTGECDGAQSPGPRTEYEPIVERPENSGIFYHDQPETQGVLFMSGT